MIFAFGLLTGTAEAEQKTTTYTGWINDDPIKLTIRWRNYSGIDRVSGYYIWQGTRYDFTGDNYATGKLLLTDEAGDDFYLYKKNSSSTIGWRGSSPTWGGATVTFSRPR